MRENFTNVLLLHYNKLHCVCIYIYKQYSHLQEGEREVYHFWCTTWPDFGEFISVKIIHCFTQDVLCQLCYLSVRDCVKTVVFRSKFGKLSPQYLFMPTIKLGNRALFSHQY